MPDTERIERTEPLSLISAGAREFLRRDQRMLIDGQWVPSAGGETLPVIDPSTATQVSSVQAAASVDVDRAVRGARRAFDDGRWDRPDPAARSRVLLRLADLVDSDTERLAELDTIDIGIPLAFSRLQVSAAAELMRYYAGWPTKIEGTVNPVGPDVLSYTLREPVGVCAAIVPWNFPLPLAVGKIAPALACGNTVVLKPAEQSSLSAVRLGELCVEAGVPPGVVQIVTGVGEVAGAALVSHPAVDKVAFTGSTEVGRLIARSGADRLARVTLELGGKNPVVIFPDADVHAAVGTLFSPFGVWYGSGQGCVHGSRILVHRSIYDEVLEAAVEVTGTVTVGSPLDPASMLGPLSSAEHFAKVMGYIDLGQREGASILRGGKQVGTVGYFVEPTLLGDFEPSMRVAREEIFGPVVGLTPFDTDEEAIRLANDTDYGLSASIWSTDIRRANLCARAIKAGYIWLNTYAEMPWTVAFGGYKQSGYGREYGAESIGTYTQTKSVTARLAPMQLG